MVSTRNRRDSSPAPAEEEKDAGFRYTQADASTQSVTIGSRTAKPSGAQPNNRPRYPAEEPSEMLYYRTHLQRPPRLPEFSGQPHENPEDFLQNILRLTPEHIDEEDLTITAEGQLRGTAKKWYESNRFPEYHFDFAEFSAKLRREYDSIPARARLEAQLLSQTQGSEPAALFLRRKQLLAQRIAPNISEEELVEIYTNLLRPEIAIHLQNPRPHTMSDLIDVASRVERAAERTRDIQHRKEARHIYSNEELPLPKFRGPSQNQRGHGLVPYLQAIPSRRIPMHEQQPPPQRSERASRSQIASQVMRPQDIPVVNCLQEISREEAQTPEEQQPYPPPSSRQEPCDASTGPRDSKQGMLQAAGKFGAAPLEEVPTSEKQSTPQLPARTFYNQTASQQQQPHPPPFPRRKPCDASTIPRTTESATPPAVSGLPTAPKVTIADDSTDLPQGRRSTHKALLEDPVPSETGGNAMPRTGNHITSQAANPQEVYFVNGLQEVSHEQTQTTGEPSQPQLPRRNSCDGSALPRITIRDTSRTDNKLQAAPQDEMPIHKEQQSTSPPRPNFTTEHSSRKPNQSCVLYEPAPLSLSEWLPRKKTASRPARHDKGRESRPENRPPHFKDYGHAAPSPEYSSSPTHMTGRGMKWTHAFDPPPREQ